MKILVLSPHRGDAAFSLSIAIHNWLMARHEVILLNVFTRSRHAPYSDAGFVHENDQLSYVSAMRLREDELFLRRMTQDLPKGLKTHLHMQDLNLKDAPIRLRIPPEDVTKTAVNPADPAIEKIRKALARHKEQGLLEALVLPAAFCRHVDHLAVREAALPFVEKLPSAFYEDLPYAANETGINLDSRGEHLGAELQESLSPSLCRSESAIGRKRALVLGYASQIDGEASDVIIDLATHHKDGERIWVNSEWRALAEANHLSSGTEQ